MSILSQIPQAHRATLETYLVEETFAPAACLMRQGDPGDGCWFIDGGTVRVEVTEHEGGPTTVVGHLGAGDIVGEMSLVGANDADSAAVRSASVYAETPLQARRLSAERYAAMESEAPAVALAFSRVIARDMADKLRSTNTRLANLVSSEEPPSEVSAIVANAIAVRSQYASAWAAEFLSSVPTDKDIVDAFLERGIDAFCLVADSVLASMDQYICDLAAKGQVQRWAMPSERSCPGVAVGRWLATGRLTLMMMQNSGFTNAMDYLRTVMLVHRIPGIVLNGWRGFDALLDQSEPHILVGDVTDSDNENTVGAEHVFGKRSGIGLMHAVRSSIDNALAGNLSCLRVSPPGFRRAYPLATVTPERIVYPDPARYAAVAAAKGRRFEDVQRDPLLSRDEALSKIHQIMAPQDPFYIVANGFNARAMQGLRLTENTFENAGGMGSTLAIAWGAAKSNPDQVFVAIDGDQNATMNEMDKVIASDYPPNLYWFIMNNGSGESVGPSLSIPLAPWLYDLAYVINTCCEKPGTFAHARINDSGLKFASEEGRAMAREMGSLPAQAHLARQILARKQAARAGRRLSPDGRDVPRNG